MILKKNIIYNHRRGNKMKKMRILHYIPGFNTGGIESVFLNWFRNIDSKEVEFELLVRNYDPGSPLLKEYIRLGGVLHTLETPSLSLKTMLSFRKKVLRFFSEHNDYDFLHVHVADDPFIIPIAKEKGIARIGIHAHTTGYNESYKSQGIKGKIRTFNVKAAQHYMAITQVAADWMFPKEIRGTKKVTIIHNGINLQEYEYNESIRQKYRKEFQIEDYHTLMHVGRFSEVKNHLFILDVFERVKLQKEKSKLIFVGDGPLLTEIVKEVNRRQLQEDVIFLGARGDIADLLQAADVFLLPSKFEGLGLSAVEAQASGLPTIVSDRVPREAAITDLVTFLSLEAPLEEWVEALTEVSYDPVRKNVYHEFMDAHYEIKQTTNDLIKFYKSTLA